MRVTPLSNTLRLSTLSFILSLAACALLSMYALHFTFRTGGARMKQSQMG